MLTTKATKAFTLIEILVVMIIIIIVTTVAVLAIGDAGRFRKAQYHLTELVSLLQYAEQYAILTPAELQFQAKNNTYTFQELIVTQGSNGIYTHHWQAISHALFNNGELSPDIRLSLTAPVFIHTNGNITPFTLTAHIRGESHYFVIQGNSAGNLTLTEKASTT